MPPPVNPSDSAPTDQSAMDQVPDDSVSQKQDMVAVYIPRDQYGLLMQVLSMLSQAVQESDSSMPEMANPADANPGKQSQVPPDLQAFGKEMTSGPLARYR